MAQVAWQCFAANDPGMMTGSYLKNTSTNVSFDANWTPVADPNLPGIHSSKNGAGFTVNNVFGRSFIICFNSYTNGTSAALQIYLDGSLFTEFDTYGSYKDNPTPYPLGSFYTSNSIPIAIPFVNLTSTAHTISITNITGHLGPSYTNLDIIYIAAPDMRQSQPIVWCWSGMIQLDIASPSSQDVSGVNLAPFQGALQTNIAFLNQMGLPVYYEYVTGVLPYGSVYTPTNAHPSNAQYAQLANKVLQDIGLNTKLTSALGNVNLGAASLNGTVIP
jgi:hypothetical protein